jgi:hypothetical protein
LWPCLAMSHSHAVNRLSSTSTAKSDTWKASKSLMLLVEFPESTGYAVCMQRGSRPVVAPIWFPIQLRRIPKETRESPSERNVEEFKSGTRLNGLVQAEPSHCMIAEDKPQCLEYSDLNKFGSISFQPKHPVTKTSNRTTSGCLIYGLSYWLKFMNYNVPCLLQNVPPGSVHSGRLLSVLSPIASWSLYRCSITSPSEGHWLWHLDFSRIPHGGIQISRAFAFVFSRDIRE